MYEYKSFDLRNIDTPPMQILFMYMYNQIEKLEVQDLVKLGPFSSSISES